MGAKPEASPLLAPKYNQLVLTPGVPALRSPLELKIKLLETHKCLSE